MLTIAKTVMHGTLCFAIENVAEPLVFVKKIHVAHATSDKNTMVRRQFHSKREVCNAMDPSGTSQHHDFANPLGVEPLSL